FGINLKLEEIYCEGCISSNCDDIKLIDSGCKVRPCVINKGYENCSQCEEFICEILEKIIVKYDDLINNSEKKISRSDRKNFIKPYENYNRLVEEREKHGAHSRMYNKMLVPTVEDMSSFIENREIITLWEKLHTQINDYYDFNKLLRYAGKNYGWVINYRYRTKSILSIHPERNAFTVLFVFGKKELEEWKKEKRHISNKTNDIIESTKQYHDGKWIWLRILGNEQFNDCLTLLNIKKKIK
ncbi:MAG: DUF3788 family protein, partial [Spirochaetales bacterium]|nr:DUF3788 family protein [Spirochaetales bacterium]